jgi:DinB family protein
MQSPSSASLRPLLDLVDEAFLRRAWHGTNLRGSIRGLTAAAAAWRPRRGRHNVWELVVHAAYWKYTVRRRLTGEKRGSFALRGSNWFTRPERAARGVALEAAWRKDVALLVAEHRRLREVLARLSPDDLDRSAPGSRTRVGVLVRGIAAHDLYHAGQIQLLKRLARA